MSVRAEYGVDVRSVGLMELADMVAWLPAGCAFWRSVGGPLSLTVSEESFRWVEYRLQVLAWLQSADAEKKRNHPKPPERIPYSGEAKSEEAHAERQASARRRREAVR